MRVSETNGQTPVSNTKAAHPSLANIEKTRPSIDKTKISSGKEEITALNSRDFAQNVESQTPAENTISSTVERSSA